MRKLTSRPQRTIARPAEVRGVGYITGADIHLRFVPAPPDTGIVFLRTDCQPALYIPATVAQVTGTTRRTTLGAMPRGVTLVEHVLATLSGLRIDNCYVEINGPEPPGLDGSARQFVEAIRQAGIVAQPAQRTIWAAAASICIRQDQWALALHPPRHEELRISYFLDYGAHSAIMPQRHSQDITPTSFDGAIASSRTYLLDHEAAELQRQGIGRRTRLTDLVVFGPRGPIDNRLRYADEPARHKILDILGDLYLSGLDIRGHIVALRSGHPANVELVRQIMARIAPQQKQGNCAA